MSGADLGGSSRPLLACLLPVRNGAADLPAYLESAARVCDLVIALDDGSTDATSELLRASPLVAAVLENPRRPTYAGWDDAGNRRRLLAAAAEFAPEWVLWLDADERIDVQDADALRTFLTADALPGCAFGLQHFRMWGERYDPNYTWIYRLFAHRPGQTLPEQRLHFDPVPVDIPLHAWVETTIRVRHLGSETEERRQTRARKYREADPDGEWPKDFGGLFARPEAKLPRWQRRPPDLPVLLPTVYAADRVAAAERASRSGRPSDAGPALPRVPAVASELVPRTDPAPVAEPDGRRCAAGAQKLVCLLPARNCAHDLPAYFESVARFADAVVALDDGSTDDTRAFLEREPLVKVLLTNPRRESSRGWDDAGNRNRLLEAAATLRPDWLFFLDGDERLDASDAAALREFVDGDALAGCAYGLKVYPMSGDPEHYDAGSGTSHPLRVYRLFAYESAQRLPDKRLHLVPVPESIPRRRWVETTLRIQHVGGMTEERRRRRFDKYAQADPDREFQSDYRNLLAPPARVVRWEPRDPGLAVIPETVDTAGLLAKLDLDGPVMSAIVISRDDEDVIERAVAALVAQDCAEPFEIIVVTSGTDRTAEIVRSRFPQVTLVQLDRPALPGEARNAGLRIARGDYVTFPGSHIELPPGSLAARIRAHEFGYPLVTGATLNGTRTWAGWASYFIDHASVLPTRPSGRLYAPPGHCSYMRELLTALNGFPEDMRAGEDTVVNMALFHGGYRAWRAQDVTMIHHSPCVTPTVLMRHHFKRGRGLGRIILDQWQPGLPPAAELRYYLRRHLPGRVRQIGDSVASWGSRRDRAHYVRAFPLVVAGAVSSWAGTWYELLTALGARRREVVAAAGFAGLEPTRSQPSGAESRGPQERAHRGAALRALYPGAPRHRVVAHVSPATRSRVRRAATAAATRAHLARRRGVTIVGITGSAGKTTTKDLLGEMLARLGPTVRTRHNDNGVYGVPATLLAVRPSDRFAVLEVGILDGPGEMRWMTRLFSPRVAVLTGIGDDHLDAYGSREAIASEKRALLAALDRHGTAIVNADDPLARRTAAGLPCRVVTAGWATDADVRIVEARPLWPHGLDLELEIRGQRVYGRVGLHTPELAHLPALAVAAAEACGMSAQDALDAAGAFTPRLGRLCPAPGPNGSMFLVDDFKSRLPNALLALRALAEVPAARRIAVLGELQEGSDDETGYALIADQLAGVDQVVAVGAGADPLLAALNGSERPVMVGVADADGAAEVLEGTLRAGDVVLLHGADHHDLEGVREALNGVAPRRRRPSHRVGRRTLEVNVHVGPGVVDPFPESAARQLTYLSMLSHEVRRDGRLEPCRRAGVAMPVRGGEAAPLLMITDRVGGRVSPTLSAEVLASATVQDRLVTAVARVTEQYGYRGVTLDFVGVRREDRDAYTGLLERLGATLRRRSVWVCSALAPPPSEAQAPPDGGAYDHRMHAALADFVIVANGSGGRALHGSGESSTTSTGPPDSRPAVREAMVRTASAFPVEKILLGVPELEDRESLEATFTLVDELGVRGVSYSALPPEGAAHWSLLGHRFQLRRRASIG